jgi:hypothetical protein
MLQFCQLSEIGCVARLCQDLNALVSKSGQQLYVAFLKAAKVPIPEGEGEGDIDGKGISTRHQWII